MRLLPLVLLSFLLALNSGCEERVHAQESTAPVSSFGWTSGGAAVMERASAGVLALGTSTGSLSHMTWSEAAAVTSCARCARGLSSVYGENPQTTVYARREKGIAPVWSGCHGCLVETLERAK